MVTNTSMKPITEIIKELLEQCASVEHERWAKWQKYMHSKCFEHTINSLNATTKQFEDIPTGNLIIPRELRNRWERQINLIYEELSEQEKESDREQVRMYLPIFIKILKERDEAIREMIEQYLDEQIKSRREAYKEFRLREDEGEISAYLSMKRHLLDKIK